MNTLKSSFYDTKLSSASEVFLFKVKRLRQQDKYIDPDDTFVNLTLTVARIIEMNFDYQVIPDIHVYHGFTSFAYSTYSIGVTKSLDNFGAGRTCIISMKAEGIEIRNDQIILYSDPRWAELIVETITQLLENQCD